MTSREDGWIDRPVKRQDGSTLDTAEVSGKGSR